MADLYMLIRKEKNKAQAWDLYLKQFHFMVEGKMKYEAFQTYYDRVTGNDIDTRPDADILAEVEEIRKYV